MTFNRFIPGYLFLYQVVFFILCFPLVLQFRGRLLIPHLSGESGPRAALIAHWLHPCQVSQNEEQAQKYCGLMIPGFIPAHVHLYVSSASEGRHFPSKPLRESQSRLLISTPSWTESDSATDKDKGQIMGPSHYITPRLSQIKTDFSQLNWWIFFPPVYVFRCQQPRDDHRKRGVTRLGNGGDGVNAETSVYCLNKNIHLSLFKMSHDYVFHSTGLCCLLLSVCIQSVMWWWHHQWHLLLCTPFLWEVYTTDVIWTSEKWIISSLLLFIVKSNNLRCYVKVFGLQNKQIENHIAFQLSL